MKKMEVMPEPSLAQGETPAWATGWGLRIKLFERSNFLLGPNLPVYSPPAPSRTSLPSPGQIRVSILDVQPIRLLPGCKG